MKGEKPVSFVEKRRPRRIADFIGHERIKKILSKFVANPYPAAFLFMGSPGVGKTSMALAMKEEMYVEFHHLNSHQANWDKLTALCEECSNYAPFVLPGPEMWREVPEGKRAMHFVLIDEADGMTETAQKLFLSKLDSTQAVRDTVWVFTCNSLAKLETRFVTRCIRLDFSEYGVKGQMQEELITHLQNVWREETGSDDGPNWQGIVRSKETNVRDCLLYLETELLARG